MQSSMQEDTSAGADASGGRVLCPATLCANEVGPAANIPHPSSRLLQDGNAAGESGTTSNIALTATRYYFSGSKRLFRSGASRLASACTMQEPTAECTLASSGMAPLMLAGMPWALSACCQADKLCFAALHGSRELPRAAPSVHAGFRFCSSRWAEGMLTRAGVLL